MVFDRVFKSFFLVVLVFGEFYRYRYIGIFVIIEVIIIWVKFGVFV